MQSAFAGAASELAAIDSTFDRGCSFFVNASHHTIVEGDGACQRGVEITRRLAHLFPNNGFQGQLHGCPHIDSRDPLAPRPSRYLDYCLKSSRLATPRQRASGTRGLIILYGLHRYFRDGWKRLEESLLRPNPEVSFDIALLTWPHFACTDRDRNPENDDCTHDKYRLWLRCDGPLPPVANFTRAMERFYAPTRLVYTQFTHWGFGAYAKPHSLHRLSRGWAMMVSLGIAQQYDHVVAMRPDAVLTRPLVLTRACARADPAASDWAPGVRLLSGQYSAQPSVLRGDDDSSRASPPPEAAAPSESRHPYAQLATCREIAHATWDLGLLACDPRALTRLVYPTWNRSVTCLERGLYDPAQVDAQWTLGALHGQFHTFALTPAIGSGPHARDCRPRASRAADSARAAAEREAAERAEDRNCALHQLFERNDTNPQRLHVGISSSTSHLAAGDAQILVLVNRTDQGWGARPALEMCVST